MGSIKSRTIWGVVLFVLVSSGVILVFRTQTPAPKKEKESITASIAREREGISINYKEEYKRWREKMAVEDAEEVYQQYKKEFQEKNPTVQHAMSHVIGELLYRKIGAAGVTVCDETFQYGCYHGFFAKALGEEGLAVVPLLDTKCREKFGSQSSPCYHGIGHGLAAFLGRKDLMKALQACDTLRDEAPFGGCPGGVLWSTMI